MLQLLEKPNTARVYTDFKRRSRTIYAGRRLIHIETDEPNPTLKQIVWRLFQEAVQTQRTIIAPGHSPIKSGMPEVYHTPAEIFATEVEMIADQISYPPRIADNPTAEALDRYEEVMTWLRYIRSHNVPRARKLLIALAAGKKPGFIAAHSDWPNANAVKAAKRRALAGIVERLQKDLSRY